MIFSSVCCVVPIDVSLIVSLVVSLIVLINILPFFGSTASDWDFWLLSKFENADFVNEVVVTDTIEHPEFYSSKKVKVVSISEMIADVIKSHESHEKIKDKYTRFH